MSELYYNLGYNVVMVGDRVFGHGSEATVTGIDISSCWPIKVILDSGVKDGFQPFCTKLIHRAIDAVAQHEKMAAIHHENAAWLQRTSLLAPHPARDDYDNCCRPAPENVLL